jgi:HD-GYP domain-containing protein (c-di-GMP phosphodiesterase class II)
VDNEGASGAGARLAEVVATLSLATDLAMGQPMERGLRTCLLACRLAEQIGLDQAQRIDVYYLSLLRHVGCTADNQFLSAIVGDELAFRGELATRDFGDAREMLPLVLRAAGAGRPPLQRAAVLLSAMASMPRKSQQTARAVCEAAELLANRFELGDSLRHALNHVYERWDGKGLPHKRKGDEIDIAARVVVLAQDAEIFDDVAGPDAASDVVRRRRGGLYDPALCDEFLAHSDSLLAGLSEGEPWDAVLAAEPPGADGVRCLEPAALDDALKAMGEFADLKSAYTPGHSRAVGDLAGAAAGAWGLPPADAMTVRRAGYIHDLGRVAVSVSIWDKCGSLTRGEWEQVRMHSYHTERLLAASPALSRLGAVAALHHERLTGDGYHRGAAASALPKTARVLAAADVYHALLERRPTRAAHAPEAAAKQLRREAAEGRLDQDAVHCILHAAGERSAARRPARAAGLTDREIEVLRLAAQGLTIKQMSAALVVSPKTVDSHLQHVYTKAGVSTRAAAVVFAMQHDLLS